MPVPKPGKAVMGESRSTVSVVRSLLSARFLLATFVLVFAATGLRPGMRALAEYYEKESIAPRRPLKEFEVSSLPSFRDGWEFTTDTISEATGTDEFVFTYLKRNGEEPYVANLFVTYYSEPRDKVPHSPDVCYRQGGAVIKKMTTIMVDTPQLAPEHPQTEVNMLILQMAEGHEQIVLFCFCVEGEFTCKRDAARWLIGKPGNRYTYFSKIETASSYVPGEDQTKAVDSCKKLFGEALGVLVAEYFPRKEYLKSR
jgi:hypothetical protein